MEELTRLVQLAGGDQETIRRLRAAGLGGAKEIAQAEVHEVCEQSGLSTAASRWLVRSAQETEEKMRARRGLRSVPSETATPTTSRSSSLKSPAARQPADQGVSKAESAALLNDPAHEQETSRSFWRFG